MVINKYVGLCDHKHIYIHIYSNYNGDKSTLFTTSCRKNGSKKLVSNSLTTNKSKLLEDETTGFTPQPHEFPANVRLNQFLESTGLTNEYLNSSIWVSNGSPEVGGGKRTKAIGSNQDRHISGATFTEEN